MYDPKRIHLFYLLACFNLLSIVSINASPSQMTSNAAEIREAKLFIAHDKEAIKTSLYPLIHKSLQTAFQSHSEFYIALSGGSLPALLSDLPQSFTDANIDPQWEKWHIVLADERLVPSTDPDSNMKAVKESFLDSVPVPSDQIYGIDESLLTSDGKIHEISAKEYQERVFKKPLENKRDCLLDCVLLGFGPDGHTASLFPGHALLDEMEALVAGIEDSPKPPPHRITLSMKVFNELSRNVIFVGAGASKAPILSDIFEKVYLTCGGRKPMECNVKMMELSKQKYPCGMIRPKSGGLTYVTDRSGAGDLVFNEEANCLSGFSGLSDCSML